MTPDTALAIDIGGTKMAVGLVSGEGRLLARTVGATPRSGDGEAVFRTLTDLIDGLSGATGAVVCGIGCGGPMEEGGRTVSPLHIPAWRCFPLSARLAAATGLPTFLDNDAKALTRGEGWVGAASGERDFLGMVVSTGIGGGIVLDGRLLGGRDGNAGHVGHVLVEPDGRECFCGGRGCVEAEASGRAIQAATGRPPSQAGASLVARTGTLVGRAVASVANLLDLRLAVVAGSVALGFGAPFFAAAQAELDRRCRLAFSRGTGIIPAALGDQAPLIGAAAVGFAGLSQRATAPGAG